MAIHLKKLESPLPKNALCQVLFKLAQWFWGERWKYEKFLDRGMGVLTDDARQAIRKAQWAFSSGKLKTKKKKIPIQYSCPGFPNPSAKFCHDLLWKSVLPSNLLCITFNGFHNSIVKFLNYLLPFWRIFRNHTYTLNIQCLPYRDTITSCKYVFPVPN